MSSIKAWSLDLYMPDIYMPSCDCMLLSHGCQDAAPPRIRGGRGGLPRRGDVSDEEAEARGGEPDGWHT